MLLKVINFSIIINMCFVCEKKITIPLTYFVYNVMHIMKKKLNGQVARINILNKIKSDTVQF